MSDAIPRRHVVAALAALAFCGLPPRAWSAPAASSEHPVRALAERLAVYADNLRYDDLDAVTIERVKSLVIDTLGCGVAALDETPVRICRDVALAFASTGG